MLSALELDDLTVNFGPASALDGISLQARAGAVTGITGNNGAGKSTLMHAVMGVVGLSRGRVSMEGDDVTGWSPRRMVARGVALVPEGRHIFTDQTVAENLRLGFVARAGIDYAQATERALDGFPWLADNMARTAGTLSGGQQQMLAIARALVATPSLLLLDEPSAGLSPLAIDLIFEKIEEINNSGVAVLMVEQNARRALAMSHRGYVLDAGRNRFEGRGPDLLNNPEVVDLYLGGARPTAPYLSA